MISGLFINWMLQTNYGSVHSINADHGIHGKAELILACQSGNYERVQNLIQDRTMDICSTDETGLSPIEIAITCKHYDCAALISNEVYYRLNNPNNEFSIKLLADLKKQEEPEFDEKIFHQIIENDPKSACLYLNHFVSESRHEYNFTQLYKIFGVNGTKTSALASILNDCIIPSKNDLKLECLEHVVVKRILDIKWELFGAQKYYQQLLLYILMLMAMTTVVSSLHGLSASNKLEQMQQVSYVVWIFTIVFCACGFHHLRQLKPDRFLKFTRWIYDGHDVYQPNFSIPEIDAYKAKAFSWLFYSTLCWSVFLATPIYFVLYFISPDYDVVAFHALVALLVLWFCVIYFIVQEMKELFGEDPWIFEKIERASYCGKLFWGIILVLYIPFVTPFMPQYRKYYASFINKLQILTYFIILGPFSFLHVVQILDGATYMDTKKSLMNAYFFFGAFSTISLWTQLLQYLEVNKTAGYLLLILYDVFGDVYDFFVFYGVYQCGFTCAFYFVFQKTISGYETLWGSFTSTYFVMFGDNGVETLIGNLTNSGESNPLSTSMMDIILTLRMFHCAVMVILLMNLLLAIVNKTVDRNWENLHTRALTSYARAILRLEKIVCHTEATRFQLTHLPSTEGSILNPIFSLPIAKEELAKVQCAKINNAIKNKVAELSEENTKMKNQVQSVGNLLQDDLDQLKLALQLRRRRSHKSSILHLQ